MNFSQCSQVIYGFEFRWPSFLFLSASDMHNLRKQERRQTGFSTQPRRSLSSSLFKHCLLFFFASSLLQSSVHAAGTVLIYEPISRMCCTYSSKLQRKKILHGFVLQFRKSTKPAYSFILKVIPDQEKVSILDHACLSHDLPKVTVESYPSFLHSSTSAALYFPNFSSHASLAASIRTCSQPIMSEMTVTSNKLSPGNWKQILNYALSTGYHGKFSRKLEAVNASARKCLKSGPARKVNSPKSKLGSVQCP